MARLYKRSDTGTWWCVFKDGTKRERKKNTHVPLAQKGSRKEAQEIAEQLAANARVSAPLPEEVKTLRHAFARRFQELEDKAQAKKIKYDDPNAGEANKGYVKGKVERLLDLIPPDTPLTEINAELGKWYLAQRLAQTDERNRRGHKRRAAKAGTIAKEWREMKAALSSAKRAGFYSGNPKEIIPPQLDEATTGKRRKGMFTVEQARMAISEIPMEWRDHFETLLFTGARAGELKRLKGTSVDLETGFLWLDTRKGNGEERKIPLREINPFLWNRLVERGIAAGEGPLFPREWLSATRGRHIKAAAREVQPHGTRHAVKSANDLRRTFVNWCLAADISELRCIHWMGHSSAQMIREVYGQTTDKLAREDGEKLAALWTTAYAEAAE